MSITPIFFTDLNKVSGWSQETIDLEMQKFNNVTSQYINQILNKHDDLLEQCDQENIQRFGFN